VSSTVLIISTSKITNITNQLNHSIVAEAGDGVEGLKVLEKYQPTIAFLDYEIEGDNTSLYINTLLIESPKTRIILVGKKLPDEIVLNSLIGGCFGYIEWDDLERFFDKSIQIVGLGEAWVSRRLVGLLLERMRD
jgi:DNA-binding NarL/FixJ family response regulator